MTDLVVEHLAKRYGDVEIFAGVDLRIVPGETVAVLGPSGSGKTTLLNIVGSLDEPTSGTIRLGDFVLWAGAPKGDSENFRLPGQRGGGRSVNEQNTDGGSTPPTPTVLAEYRARRVGFVFQEHLLLPQLTAAENVLLPTLALGERVPESKALELLQAVGVQHRTDAFPAQMSGGERQRVAVARALVNGPDLLLCDEPTGNLDQETGRAVVALLLEIARYRNTAVLMATHNLDHAAQFSRCLRLTPTGLLEGPR